jgi:hypothetical protein
MAPPSRYHWFPLLLLEVRVTPEMVSPQNVVGPFVVIDGCGGDAITVMLMPSDVTAQEPLVIWTV